MLITNVLGWYFALFIFFCNFAFSSVRILLPVFQHCRSNLQSWRSFSVRCRRTWYPTAEACESLPKERARASIRSAKGWWICLIGKPQPGWTRWAITKASRSRRERQNEKAVGWFMILKGCNLSQATQKNRSIEPIAKRFVIPEFYYRASIISVTYLWVCNANFTGRSNFS